MSNISAQLIKDSYNYVLQSDIITGIVYRIGGAIAVNPQFISGLTVNSSFTYSDGSEFPGYVLTCDALGNATWGPVSAATSSVVVTGGTFDYSGGTLELRNSNGTTVTIPGLQDIYVSGGTISGTSIIFSYNDTNTFEVTGITPYSVFSSYTANTQVTINNSITGGTYSNGTLSLINISGGTVTITGFSTTISGNYLPLSGGTVTGNTIFTSGLTANTISATTYQNLPISGLTAGQNISISGSNGNFIISYTGSTGSSSNLQYYISASTPTGTINSGDRWFNTQTGIELVYINDGDSSQWVQPFSVPGPAGQDLGVYSTTGITTSQILTWDKTYWGISANTIVNLTLPTTVGKDGYYLIIKDESGLCGNYRIRLTPSFGLIDGNNFVDMNINYMSLTCMVRNGNWYLI